MSLLRMSTPLAVVLSFAPAGIAATPKEIDTAIKAGTDYIRPLYAGVSAKKVVSGPNGLGAAAIAGLALLENGVSPDDPAVRAITTGVREGAYAATQTYHLALAILYLDRLGDPSDRSLIQLLGVRLLAGQSDTTGGWGYECIEAVSASEDRELQLALALDGRPRAGTRPPPGSRLPAADPSPSPLHLEVAKYQSRLARVRVRPRITDNSNTQFAVLGLWVARKHGVPAEAAFDAIEKRFLTTQSSGGGWPYAGSNPGTPSMTCAGLIALATAIGRREERLGGDPAKAGRGIKPAGRDEPLAPLRPEGAARLPKDEKDRAVQKALASLGPALAGPGLPAGRGKRFNLTGVGRLGDRDLYFLWSVERVGVLYGLETISGVDWYDVGADELVAAQNLSGSWGRGGRGAEVDTALALLFLARSNAVKDLTARLQRIPAIVELRGGPGPKLAAGGEKPPSAAPGGVKPPSAAPVKPPSAAPVKPPQGM